jgi:RHS repeat-associated protein
MRPAVTAGPAATPAAPFSQCPAIGNDTSCGILVNVTGSGSQILTDGTQGPYDGSDDTLIGVLNSSATAVGSLTLSSSTQPFGFDGDGICAFAGWTGVAGCPYGTTGYEGPGTSFTGITPDFNGGIVVLSPALQPGQSAYFSLEEPLTGSQVTAGGPTTPEQGSAANPSEHSTTCSILQPVNCATGVFWHQFTDVSVQGRGVALDLSRTYSSSRAGTDGPLGFGWTDSYNMSLAVDQATGNVTVTQEDGSPVTFAPNGSGGFAAPPRVLASLVLNADGSYTFIRSGSQVQYTFTASGQLVKEVDLNGYLTSLAYNPGGQLATVTDPAGRTLTFAYAGSHLTGVTGPMGRAWAYAYDASGNLASATDPLGRTSTFTYDASHLLLSMKDPRGGTTTNTYNASGQVVSQVGPDGGATTFSWSGDPASPAGAANTMTDPNGNVTQYQYANMELASVTHAFGTPLAATTSYAYDPATLGVTTVTDPAGHVTTSGYDSAGNLLSTTSADGHTTSYSYNGFNELTSKSTPLGEFTSYSYDGNGNLVSVSDPLGTTSYAHDSAAAPGDVTSMTNPDGNVTTYAYDSDGDLASAATTPSAGVTDTVTYAYDAAGERTCQALGNATASGITCPAAGAAPAGTTATAYDAAGQVTGITDPLGHVTSYGYDGNGNKVKVTDAAGHVTSYAYDASNQQVKVTQPDGTTQATTYDATGSPVKQVSASGAITVYAFNALSQVTSSTGPLGHVTKYGYDAAGDRASVTDPQGQVTTYGYDAAGLETSISYSDGKTPGVTYAYDADGRRAAMTDGTGTTTYAYDGDSHVTSVTSGAGATVSYAYDAAGLLTSLTYPNGQVVTHAYDGAARLASIADGLGHTTTFSYDHDGNLLSKAYPNGVTATSAYDASDQLAGITDKTSSATLASYAYTRDSLGQVTAAAETGAGAGPQAYSYTQLSQLASDSSGAYGYDPAGDLTKQPGGITQAFNADGQLTSASAPGAPAAPALDRSVSATQASRGASVTAPALTTRAAGELVLAFVSANGPAGKAQQVTTVTGGGLTWRLAARADGQQGTAEVWQAYAAKVISNAKVTAAFRYKGADGAITVAAFKGARSAAGAHAAASKASGAPAVSLTTTGALSLVWAAGEDPLHATARTVAAGQALVADAVDAKGKDTFWSQRTGTIAAARTAVKVADTKPTADKWNLAAVEVLAAAPAGSSTAYGYNADGDLASITPAGKAATSLAYDQAGRLTGYGAVATYAYDGDGLRMSKKAGATATGFAWDQSGSLPLLIAAGTISYVYGPDGTPIEQVDTANASTVSYLLPDQLGSTRLITDGSGAVTGTYAYSSYGVVTRHAGAGTTALQYDGQYADAESGLQYLRARYYNPATGQFLTLDPMLAVTLAPYGYAVGNPVNSDDPNGECGFLCAAIGAGAGALVGVASGGVECLASYAAGKFNAGECAANVVSDAAGGAVSGACVGFSAALALAACGAAGALVTDGLKKYAFGQDVSLTEAGWDAGFGAIGGVVGLKLFPRGPGRPPIRWNNLLKPGPVTKGYYKAGATGAVFSLLPGLARTIFC